MANKSHFPFFLYFYKSILTNLNFYDIIIKKSPYDKQYYIFKKDAESESDYIYYAKNKDIIEGWLYGAIMAKNKRM